MARHCLLLADIHANYYALESVLDDAAGRIGRWDDCWFLGDLVGYGPQPVECVQLLRDDIKPSVAVLGNHDAALVGRINTGPGWSEDAITALEKNRQMLAQDEEIKQWAYEQFNTWPDTPLCVATNGQSFFAVHGTLDLPVHGYLRWARGRDGVEELTASSEFKHLRQLYKDSAIEGPRRELLGQTHIPTFLRAREVEPPDGEEYSGSFDHVTILFNEGPQELGKLPIIINPGSVGQPRDRDPRAAYAIINVDEQTVEFRRVKYDHEKTKRRMQNYEFPRELCDRLALGE